MAKNDATQLKERKSDDSQTITDLSGDAVEEISSNLRRLLRSSSVGLIIRQKEPNNLETPFDQIDSFLTPTELFYIRSHFPAPKLDLASYQLRIGGAVRKPFSLSYKD